MVILLQCANDLHMAQLMPDSATLSSHTSSKSGIINSFFWCQLMDTDLENRLLNGCFINLSNEMLSYSECSLKHYVSRG